LEFLQEIRNSLGTHRLHLKGRYRTGTFYYTFINVNKTGKSQF
jgi:hypothetical protein